MQTVENATATESALQRQLAETVDKLQRTEQMLTDTQKVLYQPLIRSLVLSSQSISVHYFLCFVNHSIKTSHERIKHLQMLPTN